MGGEREKGGRERWGESNSKKMQRDTFRKVSVKGRIVKTSFFLCNVNLSQDS